MTLTYVVANLNGGTIVTMDAEQEAAFLSAQAESQSAQERSDLISKAQVALDKSDLTATRCFKAGVSFPSEWQTYVTSLRSIASSGTGSLPDQPPYPIGT